MLGGVHEVWSTLDRKYMAQGYPTYKLGPMDHYFQFRDNLEQETYSNSL